MNRKNLLLVFIALAIVVVIALIYEAYFAGKEDSSVAFEGSTYGIQLSSYDRTMGSPKAPLMVVEYAAPTCPHCAYFDINVFPQFKENWIDTGKAYYVFRVFPLNPVDIAAEAMARCLPANQYFQFIDMLYRNQPKWDPDGYQIPDVHAALVQMGETAGMTAQQVDSCIGNADAQKRISQVGQEAMTKYNVSGTPTFLVRGQMHGPFADYQDMNNFLVSAQKKQ